MFTEVKELSEKAFSPMDHPCGITTSLGQAGLQSSFIIIIDFSCICSIEFL